MKQRKKFSRHFELIHHQLIEGKLNVVVVSFLRINMTAEDLCFVRSAVRVAVPPPVSLWFINFSVVCVQKIVQCLLFVGLPFRRFVRIQNWCIHTLTVVLKATKHEITTNSRSSEKPEKEKELFTTDDLIGICRKYMVCHYANSEEIPSLWYSGSKSMHKYIIATFVLWIKEMLFATNKEERVSLHGLKHW